MRREVQVGITLLVVVSTLSGHWARGNSVPQSNQMQAAQAPENVAMDALETVLEIHPQDQDARDGEVKAAVVEALTLRNQGLMNQALAVLARARSYVPDDPNLLMDFGLQADSMHIYRDAETALQEAHDLVPGDPKILYGLAHVELDEQKMPQAQADLQAYLKMCPEDASAHYGLGHLLHMMLKDDEAKLELERSLQLQPQQTESWYELGEIALSRHETNEARSDYKRVLQRDSNHGGALTGMGMLAYWAKDYASSESYLSRAVAAAPAYPASHRFYAMVLARQGKKEQAGKEEALASRLTEQQNRLQHGYVLLEQQHDHP